MCWKKKASCFIAVFGERLGFFCSCILKGMPLFEKMCYLCHTKTQCNMKKLLLTALLAVTIVAQAQTITIGEGSGMSSQVPFNTFYNYSFTEQIFQAGEIEYSTTGSSSISTPPLPTTAPITFWLPLMRMPMNMLSVISAILMRLAQC